MERELLERVDNAGLLGYGEVVAQALQAAQPPQNRQHRRVPQVQRLRVLPTTTTTRVGYTYRITLYVSTLLKDLYSHAASVKNSRI